MVTVTKFLPQTIIYSFFHQIDLFSNTVHENQTTDSFIVRNFRPTQVLNDRVVTSQPTISTNTTLSTNATANVSSASTLHHTLFISTVLFYVGLSRCL